MVHNTLLSTLASLVHTTQALQESSLMTVYLVLVANTVKDKQILSRLVIAQQDGIAQEDLIVPIQLLMEEGVLLVIIVLKVRTQFIFEAV